MIGIMVPDIRGYFESQSAYELEKKLDSFAYTTLLCVTTDENEKIVNVYIDEIEAIDQTVKLFKDNYYKKPLYLPLDTGYMSRSYISKKLGFVEALYKYYDDANFVEFKVKDPEEDLLKLIDFLRKHPEFDSIQFELDRLAVNAYKLMANEGIKIPEDLGIIGFDNIHATDFTNQAITSIDQRISD